MVYKKILQSNRGRFKMKTKEDYYVLECPKCKTRIDCAPEIKNWVEGLDITHKILIDLKKLLNLMEDGNN